MSRRKQAKPQHI
nr:Chain C, MET-SER-ARG-ARG-LYS-GLN-ALA-LYS-PRO-GLN-HIS-ILE [Homo sapiens]5XWR_D Chain D, MET-SER-ARG-ARG-LYS-GLN-ALA-LYS-PRO-GLN-HIS-ILE [Homo sapiens]